MIINMVQKFIRILKVLNNFLRKKEKKEKLKNILKSFFEFKNSRIFGFNLLNIQIIYMNI